MRTGLLLFLLGLAGCERGCLSSSLRQRGGEEPAGAPSPGAFDLAGTDCSDGLVRCVGGRLEVSRAAHLPASCADLPPSERARSSCVCPWEPAGACAGACAAEALELALPAELAGQLCRPDGPVARPVGPGEEAAPRGVCAAEGYRCVEGVVTRCGAAGAPEQGVGVCLHGCEVAAAVDPGDSVTADGAVAILCRRDHAERR